MDHEPMDMLHITIDEKASRAWWTTEKTRIDHHHLDPAHRLVRNLPRPWKGSGTGNNPNTYLPSFPPWTTANLGSSPCRWLLAHRHGQQERSSRNWLRSTLPGLPGLVTITPTLPHHPISSSINTAFRMGLSRTIDMLPTVRMLPLRGLSPRAARPCTDRLECRGSLKSDRVDVADRRPPTFGLHGITGHHPDHRQDGEMIV